MNRGLALCLVGLFLMPSASALAGEHGASEKKIKALIEQLASSNKAPKALPDEDAGPDAEYPAGYDHKAQSRILATWTKLRDLGAPAFPYLLERAGDKRYSFTEDEGSADYNWSVGRACLDAVRCNLQPYGWYASGNDDDQFPLHRPNYVAHYKLGDPKAAKEWWAVRKEKSLRELQIETVQWVIAEEAKTPKTYSDNERSYLRGLLDKLLSAKTPLDASLPWAK